MAAIANEDIATALLKTVRSVRTVALTHTGYFRAPSDEDVATAVLEFLAAHAERNFHDGKLSSSYLRELVREITGEAHA